MLEVIRELIDDLASGREALLCQVVETKGSTPQKAGAGMLVRLDGGQAGTLGGGCVEAEVKQRASGRIGLEGAELYQYLLDHDYAWADGLICGGRMRIVAEALRGDEASTYYREYGRLLDAGDGLTEAVVVDPESAGIDRLGARLLIDAEGRAVAAYPGGVAGLNALADEVSPLADRPRPTTRRGVAYLPSLPRVRLLIVGAGHVGQAVAGLAARADFEVWVADDRRQYADASRFPEASRLIVGPLEETLPALDIDARTYALIVTRGHGHDQEALALLAPTDAAWVGLIGSHRKIRMIFESLLEDGLDRSALERVSAPVGLEIGSESVPEIAVSIVAELIGRRNLGPSAASGNRHAPVETRKAPA